MVVRNPVEGTRAIQHKKKDCCFSSIRARSDRPTSVRDTCLWHCSNLRDKPGIHANLNIEYGKRFAENHFAITRKTANRGMLEQSAGIRGNFS